MDREKRQTEKKFNSLCLYERKSYLETSRQVFLSQLSPELEQLNLQHEELSLELGE